MKITMPRQVENYTCGIAALATVAKLLGISHSQDKIFQEVETFPKVGTDHNMLGNYACEKLNATTYGEDTYKGGLAIANIQNKDSSIGHYVVFLGQRGGGNPLLLPTFRGNS